jgi:sugar O-acyltransferase (sialic acid O-acetyltransferase NeuD family)
VKPLVILGTGGYGQEVLWIVDDLNAITSTWDFLGFIDPGEPQKKGQTYYDRPVLGGWNDLPNLAGEVFFACGIGAPKARRKECAEAERLGLKPATLIHPSAVIARHVQLGEGTLVGAGSIIAPYARLGRHCALNIHVGVGHNSRLADFCVLSPGARTSGFVELGERAFLGTNASVYQGCKIGADASIGANSFQASDLDAGSHSLGVPARKFMSFHRPTPES